jgi:hypothetical protein
VAQQEDISKFVPPPPDEGMQIWRYLDFTKFVAMLDSKSLFFARVSTLDDPFEGSFPPAQSAIERLRGAFPSGSLPPATAIELAPGLEDIWKAMRDWAMVNCWHASTHESAAMWRLYAPTTTAVAIRSTVRRLRGSIGSGPPLPQGFGGSNVVHIGMIEYIDFKSQRIPDGSFAAQFFRKRRSFEHERELRALILQFPVVAPGRVDYARRPTDRGLSVPVDLSQLIEQVLVAPQAPAWYAKLVARVADKYGLKVVPTQSELDATPLY